MLNAQEQMSAEDELLSAYTEGDSVYKRNRSQHTDVGWKLTYAVVLALTFVGAVYALFNTNVDFKNLRPEYLSNPSNCPSGGGRRLFSLRASEPDDNFDLSEFWRVGKYWIGSTLAVSIAIGALFVFMFEKLAIATVWLCMGLFEAMWVAGAIVPLLAGEGSGATSVAIVNACMALLWLWVLYRWRSRLVLCGQLLCVASKALLANPALTPTVITLGAAFALAEVPLAVFGVLAAANGTLHPALQVSRDASSAYGCVDVNGKAAYCCEWRVDSWTLFYWPLLALAMVWTWSIGCQLQAYVISGAAAQWYFLPADQSSVMRTPSTRGFVRRSLGHGLTTSFGSICFSALVLPVVRGLKQMKSSQSFIGAFVRCLFQAVLEFIEVISQFATVSMAITGKSFLESGRAVTGLLARNLLSSVGVWIFPNLILGIAAAVLALAWSVTVYVLSSFSWDGHPQGQQDAFFLAALAFLASVIVLSFYKGVLLNVVDGCYICYAMDLDNRAVTRNEIHDIYHALPTGKLVVQPDEELAYGSAEDGQNQPAATAAAAQSSARPLGPLMHEPIPMPQHYTQPQQASRKL